METKDFGLICVGYREPEPLNKERCFLILNEKTSGLALLTESDVRKRVDSIVNLEVKNGRVTTSNGALSRYEMTKFIMVVIKKFVDNKGNTVGYSLWDGLRIVKWKEQDIVKYVLQMRKNTGIYNLGFANAKIVEAEGKRPYIASLNGDFPISKIDSNNEKLMSEVVKIIANNIKSDVVEFSMTGDSRLDREINTAGVEPLIKALETKGVSYDTEEAAKVLKKATEGLGRVYFWEMYTKEIQVGKPVFRRFSCDKQLLEEDMKNYLLDEALADAEGNNQKTEEIVAALQRKVRFSYL